MSAVAAAIVGAAAIGGTVAYMSSSAQQDAANKQLAAEGNATALQWAEFQQQEADTAPWRNAGSAALSQMQNGQFQAPFTMADFQSSPGYGFQMQQGLSALQNSAAARGGLMSGNTGQALENYGQGLANTDYQQAFNNYNTTNSLNFNRLASIAGLGQTAVGQSNQAAQNFATNAGQNMIGGANAQAAAGIGSANAWGGAISGIGNNWMQYSMMNRFAPQQQNLGSMGNYGANYGGSAIPGAEGYMSPIDNMQMPTMGSEFGGAASAPSLLD